MLIKLNLRAINTEAHCVGQTNTYVSSCGNSMIDYILLEEDLVPSVRHVEIALETPNNTAFHLPVIFHIELNKMNETLLSCSEQRIAWSKRTTNDIETYIENLANYLASGCSPQHFLKHRVKLMLRCHFYVRQFVKQGRHFHGWYTIRTLSHFGVKN